MRTIVSFLFSKTATMFLRGTILTLAIVRIVGTGKWVNIIPKSTLFVEFGDG